MLPASRFVGHSRRCRLSLRKRVADAMITAPEPPERRPTCRASAHALSAGSGAAGCFCRSRCPLCHFLGLHVSSASVLGVSSMPLLQNEVICITGASSGVGAVLASCLGQEGAKKLILVAEDQDGLKTARLGA